MSLNPSVTQSLHRLSLQYLILCALGGCAAVPGINGVVNDAHEKPRLSGSHGPLTEKESKAILAKLEREAGGSDVLQRHLALESALDDNPISVGNKVTLLPSGDASLSAIFSSIESAKHNINLEYYTFEDVDEKGRDVGQLLAQKALDGLQIDAIYDSFGSRGTPDTYFSRLKGAGVKMVDFNPVNPFKAKGWYAPNNRDHRKILVVDGEVGIIGGVNLSKVYSSSPFKKKAAKGERWKDTDLEIEGPGVAQLQKLFLSTWQAQKGEVLDESGFFPSIAAKGHEVLHVLGSDPSEAVPEYYASLLSAIRNAENKIWISAAYFVPTRQEIRELVAAAHRNVDVELLLPGLTDSSLALDAGRSRYTTLLDSGVKIYEMRDAILHSKTAVIDGVWSAVGSSNFDHRSVIYNSEVDVIVLGPDTGQQLEALFQTDIGQAARIDLTKWKHRPFWERMKEFFAGLWENLL